MERVDTSEVKKILKSCWYLEDSIQDDLDALARLRAQLEKTTSTWSLAPGGSSNDKMATGLARLTEREECIARKKKELLEQFAAVSGLIDTLPDTRMRMVLNKRYLQHKNWEQIRKDMTCSPEWVYKLHGRAILFLSKKNKRVQ